MTNEATPQDPKDEEYAKKLRSARIRAVFVLVGTLVAVGIIYEKSITNGGLPVASCKTDHDCAGTDEDPLCVSAPTGSYCSHACNETDDCRHRFVCAVPPWTPGKTDKICIHDSAHIGQ